MNTKFSDLIIPILAFFILMALFLIYITFSFEDTPRQECVFPAEFDCIAYQVTNETTDTITIQIINKLGEEVNLTRATIPNSACSYSISPIINSTKRWPKETIMWVTFDCKELEHDKGMVTINLDVVSYLDDQNLRFTGRIRYYDY